MNFKYFLSVLILYSFVFCFKFLFKIEQNLGKTNSFRFVYNLKSPSGDWNENKTETRGREIIMKE